MNNIQIIIRDAVASGYFTEDEVGRLLSEGKDIPFHTYAIWKARGMVPKKGSHGYETMLWRKKGKKPDDADNSEVCEEKDGFYLTKSYLFHISQCERCTEEQQVDCT